MHVDDVLADAFESHRPRLRAVAYRMLGSLSEADDAVQETWLRLSRSDADAIENLGGWLTTVASRVCLNMLRARATRAEQPFPPHTPDPIVSRVDASDPEHEALLGDSVGLALLVVLDTLTPTERLAFVLHDIFAVPFGDVATILAVSEPAARQLASRARRRVGTAPMPDADPARQRAVVDAFFAASRRGDFAALLTLLDPDAVLRSDGGPDRVSLSRVLRGGRSIGEQAIMFAQGAPFAQPAIVNGAAGVVVARNGQALSVMGFVVRADAIAAIDVLADPVRLSRLDLSPWLG
ncbi:sigma-70 family RNA polymerase sigma factor [Mycetocola zhadangensis]|uniref:Sigma-70 family RNA polymerase sigma factor n=1 Tax=Mycetocola zhadangensis TaxID=1164595 RepID=A0A3L7J4Q3_9MICO|nr:sigma-70 family RNA polymerase sigma factor [Mycetocola zhadangensis]RLQ84441.1 sigma-70 family RNA polymerase sigma factor [Mycetocola zhadangensis]GGE92975.1 DNA-directed RNA polymerase sigma-70 factor [Mycetocola zhadangensis]